MSRLVLVKNLKQHQKINKIVKDCNVKEIQKFSLTNLYTKKKEVETLDIFEVEKDKILVAIPFSYYYHNLTSITTIDFDYSKIEMRFVGELLERQKILKEDVFEILNRTGSILLCLHTGFGKTIFALPNVVLNDFKKAILFGLRKI